VLFTARSCRRLEQHPRDSAQEIFFQDGTRQEGKSAKCAVRPANLGALFFGSIKLMP
jgi:hypothetical protein